MIGRNRFRTTSSVALVLGLILAAGAAKAQPAGEVPGQEAEQQKRALARLTMPDAAKRPGGHYVRPFDVSVWSTAGSVEDLTKFSELVVVGEVIGGASVLSDDQMYIKTNSTVRVVEVIKGSVVSGSMVTVVTPGGRVTFSDGTSAETATPEERRLLSGRWYVLFLEPADKKAEQAGPIAGARGGYIPLLGGQGIFELRKDRVVSGARNTDPVKQESEKGSVDAFVARVRKAKLAAEAGK